MASVPEVKEKLPVAAPEDFKLAVMGGKDIKTVFDKLFTGTVNEARGAIGDIICLVEYKKASPSDLATAKRAFEASFRSLELKAEHLIECEHVPPKEHFIDALKEIGIDATLKEEGEPYYPKKFVLLSLDGQTVSLHVGY